MRLLLAGNDVTVIALWLGHEQIETTNLYLHADMSHKAAGDRPDQTARRQAGRYRPSDSLLAFLVALDYADNIRPFCLPDQGIRGEIGITRRSA